VLVDDCSQDETWAVLGQLKGTYPNLKIARLLRNSGQHNAILCGFTLVTGDVIVTMDDDLQNPPEEIPKLVEAIDSGMTWLSEPMTPKNTLGPETSVAVSLTICNVASLVFRAISNLPVSGPFAAS